MKTRYAFLYFNICEYKVLETYLRQMAKKGWALDSIFGYIFIFTKKKQPKHTYYVDFNMSRDASKNAQFHDMIEEYGYAYVAGNSLLSVFGSDEDMEIPIRGDDEITYQQLNKAGRWMNWGNLIVGLLWIIIGLLSDFQYYDHVVYRISLMSVGFTQILIGMIWLSVSYPFIQWRMFKKTSFTLWSIQLRSYFVILCTCAFLCTLLLFLPIVVFCSILILVSLLLLLKSLWEASGKRLSRIFAALFALILTCVLMGSNLISAYYKARANTTLEAMNTMVKEYMVEQGYQYEPGMTLTDNSIIFSQKESSFMAQEKTWLTRLYLLEHSLWKEDVRKDILDQLGADAPHLQKEQLGDMQIYKNADTAIYVKGDFIVYTYSEEQKELSNEFVQALFAEAEKKSG